MSRKSYRPTPRRLELTASRVDHGVVLCIRELKDSASRHALQQACLYGIFSCAAVMAPEPIEPVQPVRETPDPHTPH